MERHAIFLNGPIGAGKTTLGRGRVFTDWEHARIKTMIREG